MSIHRNRIPGPNSYNKYEQTKHAQPDQSRTKQHPKNHPQQKGKGQLGHGKQGIPTKTRDPSRNDGEETSKIQSGVQKSNSRRIQGKDRKSNREKQGKTHDGKQNRMGTRKMSKIHGQTHKKPSKHNIQGKSQNAGSKSQLQKQVPRQSMQDMPPRGGNSRSRTTTMRIERHTKNSKRGNLQGEHRHPEKSCGKDTSNYESTNMR